MARGGCCPAGPAVRRIRHSAPVFSHTRTPPFSGAMAISPTSPTYTLPSGPNWQWDGRSIPACGKRDAGPLILLTAKSTTSRFAMPMRTTLNPDGVVSRAVTGVRSPKRVTNASPSNPKAGLRLKSRPLGPECCGSSEDGLPSAAEPRLTPGRVVQPDAGGEVGPAVPGALDDLVEVLVVTNDVAVVAFVDAVLGGEQPPVGCEGDAVRIAQPPGDQLEVAAVGVAPQHRPVAPDVALDDLPGRGLGPERDVGAGLDRGGRIAQHVGHLVVPPRQHDVPAWHVMLLREAGQPLVGEVVRADDCGVGARPLTEVDLAVGADDGVIGLVVALARQAGDQVLKTLVGGDPRQRVGVHQIQLVVVPAGPGDRAPVTFHRSSGNSKNTSHSPVSTSTLS